MLEENKMFFNKVCEMQDTFIKKLPKVISVGFIIGKDDTLEVIPLLFNDRQEIEICKEALKRKVLINKTKAYALMVDAKITQMDLKNKKEPKTYDCFIRTLYTPQGKLVEICYYEGNKIIKKERPSEKVINSGFDSWDVWSRSERKMTPSELKKYNDWKASHPENYKDC